MGAVRRADRAHIVHVTDLTRAFYHPSPQSSPSWNRYAWADRLERDRSAQGFAGVVDDVPVGFAVVRRHGEEAELCYLLVAPQYRGQGVGTRLLAWVLEWVRSQGCTAIQFTVAATNEPVLRLYGKAGFRVRQHLMRAEFR